MKIMQENAVVKISKGLLCALCAFLLFTNCKMIIHAETTGKITAESAKVRAETNTTSNVVGSVARGSTVTITNEVTDGSGTLWYEVYVDANTRGYIRSDLMEKSGDSTAAGSSPAASNSNQNTASGAESSAETPVDAQYATVNVASAKIRSGPSTNNGVVASLSQGTQLVITGQSNGSDGKLWFYVTFGDAGAEKTGFVRSDLIERGEMVPVEEPEEEQPEESPEEGNTSGQPENGEYELVYATNEDGEYEWWLYNHEEGTRQKLEEVLAAAHANSLDADADAKMVSTQRIIVIVLVAVIIILAVVMTIMFFKLRDAYYEDYEDDEEEDDEDEEDDEEPIRRSSSRRSQPVRDASRMESYRSRRPEEPERRRSDTSQNRNTSRRRAAELEDDMPVREVSYEDDPEYVKPARTPKKKVKNIMLDDDDFEFEFLNISDKDR